jgi:hypothetical protein
MIYLGVHYSNPGDPGNATGPEISLPGYEEPKPAKFTAADQRAVHGVLRKFIVHAVARQDVPRSWEYAGPSLREGFTRKDWKGDIPVVPYPAANRGLGQWDYVEYSYKNDVGLEVFLFPKPGSGYSAMTADAEVVKGADGRWRVDYWMPKKFHGPPAVAASTKRKVRSHKRAVSRAVHHPKPSQTKTAATPEAANPAENRQSRIWWIVPLSVIGLVILAPLSIGLVIWLQNRRARQQYLRSRAG